MDDFVSGFGMVNPICFLAKRLPREVLRSLTSTTLAPAPLSQCQEGGDG